LFWFKVIHHALRKRAPRDIKGRIGLDDAVVNWVLSSDRKLALSSFFIRFRVLVFLSFKAAILDQMVHAASLRLMAASI
jgi:hypothetical protein